MEEIQYNGRTITVDLEEARGGWVWTYQIDDGPLRRCKDRPIQSRELMLSEGISTAKAEIDGRPVQ